MQRRTKLIRTIRQSGARYVAWVWRGYRRPNERGSCRFERPRFTLRARWFSPLEILRQATSGNAGLLAMSSRRNPYPGKLGVKEEGAYADILLINGEPLQDITLLEHPDVALALIMKDGGIYRNQLSSARAAH